MRSTRFGMLLGVVALGALMMPLASVAAPVPAPPPLEDSVTGRASTTDLFTFDISAQSGPSGENPTGQVTLTSAGFPSVSGSVTCLTVHKNVALIKIRLSPSAGASLLSLRITDLPVDASLRPQDRIDVGLTSTAASECSSPEPTYFSEQRVFTGDITVVDAPSFPTSKQQCKNGGYTSFGFKNQGACVAFVQRGPKPKP
jgi:hypothetical protein